VPTNLEFKYISSRTIQSSPHAKVRGLEVKVRGLEVVLRYATVVNKARRTATTALKCSNRKNIMIYLVYQH
jgi:hypothetical protein